MRKVYLFAGMAAMLLASCSSNDKLDLSPKESPTAAASGNSAAVGFDVYSQRTTTRAGVTGAMTTEVLKHQPTDEQKKAGYKGGFGVFGYYTNNNDYDPQSLPDFFYNQQVLWNGTDKWEYEPLKYWPNEYGTTAISEEKDKVSFFAYAPYVTVIPSTGKLTASADSAKWGITGMSRNSNTGDPLIKYIASFKSSESVDLVWGVCDQPNDWAIVETGTIQQPAINDGVAGLPWLNVQRPSQINQRMKFTFKHALTQLNVNIDTYADTEKTGADAAADTKVYVRSVSFEGMATKGALNLNNTEPNKALWLDYNGTADLESGEVVTIHDGRKDGKEGAVGSTANNEKTLGLNPTIISNDNNTTEGVKGTLKSLFDNTTPIYVIPTGEEVKVEIVYDVETADKNLATYLSDRKTTGSSIENRIRKTVVFGDKDYFESGKHYTINLHLGMNSVKLDAEVGDWVEANSEADIDLPLNVPSFEAGAAGAASSVTIPALDDAYNFAITGLNGGEGVTATNDGTVVTALTSNAANASGVAVQKATIAPNMSVKAKTGTAKIVGNASGREYQLNITQLPHALDLSVSAITANLGTVTLASGATDIDWVNDIAATGIKVMKNGVALTKVDSWSSGAARDKEFRWKADKKRFHLGKEATVGDVFTITVKAGDAEEETVVVKVGGIAFASASPSIVYGTKNFDNIASMYGVKTVSYASDNAAATVDSSTGVITTAAAGTANITATVSAFESGYIVPATCKYELTITQATGCELTAKNITLKKSEVDGFDLSSVVKLLNANGDELEAGSSATEKAGQLEYTYVSQSVANHIKNTVADGIVKKYHATNPTYQPQAGDVYKFHVKVNAASNGNVAYAAGKDEADITITVVAD